MTAPTRAAVGARRDAPGNRAADDGFARELAALERPIKLHCYRLVGSLHDAEEATQEALLRAWRGRASYRGDASLGTWLHRIATRACLDLLERRPRRVTPQALAAAATPDGPPAPDRLDVPWLEPIPDDLVDEGAEDPAARISRRESVSLAFIAALQTLPARQRAVLLLRDVLAWDAAGTGEALDMTVPAVHSALFRARTALRRSHHRTGADAIPSAPPTDPVARRLLAAYMAAWEAADVDRLVEVLRQDIRLTMPPSPSWFAGRSAVVGFLGGFVLAGAEPGEFALRSTGANGQPAAILSRRSDKGTMQAVGVHVLDVRGGAIAALDCFMEPRIAARFEAAGPPAAVDQSIATTR